MSFLFGASPIHHWLALAILLSRLGDIGSTYLATPNLKLESNPFMRKGGWKLAWVSTLACLIAYWDVRSGIMILVASLLVTGSNLGKAWAMRALGEDGYDAYMLHVVRSSSMPAALGFVLGSAASVALVGVILVVFSDEATVGFWVGYGIILYAVVVALYGSLSIVRTYRRLRSQDAELARRLAEYGGESSREAV